MNDNLKERMLQQAREALQAEPSSAEQNYNHLIDELELAFGKNHKEVAAELQRIAKAIEDGGDIDSAFAFKQRTCEIMLKRNMEQRRRDRPTPHVVTPTPPPERPLAPPHVVRLLGPMEYVCFPTANASDDAAFYKRTLHAEQLFEHNNGGKVVGVKFAQGPALLLVEGSALTQCQPAFATDDAGKILAELKKHGVEPDAGPLSTGLGSLYSFKDSSGNHFAVIEKRRGR